MRDESLMVDQLEIDGPSEHVPFSLLLLPHSFIMLVDRKLHVLVMRLDFHRIKLKCGHYLPRIVEGDHCSHLAVLRRWFLVWHQRILPFGVYEGFAIPCPVKLLLSFSQFVYHHVSLVKVLSFFLVGPC